MNVFSELGIGGAELRTLEMVRNSGLHYSFLSVLDHPAPLDDQVVSDGHLLNHIRVRGLTGVLPAAKLMREQQIQVVHSHLGMASGPVLLAARIAGVPTRVAFSHSDGVGGRKSRLKDLYLAWSRALTRATATDIVAVSPGALKGSGLNKGRWAQRSIVIPHGMDTAELRGRAEAARAQHSPQNRNALVVAHIARDLPTKNRTRAIEIWRQLALETPSVLKLIGGMSEQETAFAQEVAADPRLLPAGSRIDFVGETDRVPEQLGESDVLLMTSEREGLPGILLESLACGTPVVATPLPGVEWIASLSDGIHTVELSESDAAWVQAVQNSAKRSRDEVAASFATSPFQLDVATNEHLKLWGIDNARTVPRVIRFFTLARLSRDREGRYHSDTPLLGTDEWDPFLEHFDEVQIVARVTEGEPSDEGALIERDGVSVIEMPFWDGSVQYYRRSGKIRKFLKAQTADKNVAYGIWAPAQISPVVSKNVRDHGGSLLVRLIGDAEDVAASIGPKGLRGVLRALARRGTASTVARADAVIYVTLKTLQEKYPAAPGALTLARTNLRMSPDQLSVRRGDYSLFVAGAPVSLIAVGSQQQNYKGHDLLIDAVAELRSRGHELRLTLVGQGQFHDALVAQAAESGLDVNFVPHAGSTLDVAHLVAEHDFFVMPSRTEGMPKALLEAMSAGVFSLGSSVGGIVEVLAPEHRFASDNLDALIGRLEYFLANREEVPAGVREQTAKFADFWENHSGPRVMSEFLARWTAA